MSHSYSRLLRKTMSCLMTLVLGLAACTTLTGCAGDAARDHVAMPALMLIDDRVLPDARAGVASLPEAERPAATSLIQQFDEAINSGDRSLVVSIAQPLWEPVKALAVKGIEAMRQSGTISAALANSKQERLKQYGDLLSKIR